MRHVLGVRSVLAPLLIAVALSASLAFAVALDARAPGPDANIGLGILLLVGLPSVAVLLLWVLVRGAVLLHAAAGRGQDRGGRGGQDPVETA